MNAADFEAVTYDGAVYCVGCLPEGVDVDDEAVSAIFADSEWDSYPVCDACHYEHDYVNLTTDGWIARREANWSPKMRDMARRHREEGSSDYSRALPRHTSIGGYTVLYVDKGGESICGKCANDTSKQLSLVDCGTYDEGPTLECAECGDDIESSYGDPDAPETAAK